MDCTSHISMILGNTGNFLTGVAAVIALAFGYRAIETWKEQKRLEKIADFAERLFEAIDNLVSNCLTVINVTVVPAGDKERILMEKGNNFKDARNAFLRLRTRANLYLNNNIVSGQLERLWQDSASCKTLFDAIYHEMLDAFSLRTLREKVEPLKGSLPELQKEIEGELGKYVRYEISPPKAYCTK